MVVGSGAWLGIFLLPVVGRNAGSSPTSGECKTKDARSEGDYVVRGHKFAPAEYPHAKSEEKSSERCGDAEGEKRVCSSTYILRDRVRRYRQSQEQKGQRD